MLSVVLLVALGHVSLAGCEGARLDEGLLQGLMATQPAADFEVRCTGERIRISRLERGQAVLVRELELPPGSPAMRARTLAFVLGELAVGRVPVAPRNPPDAGPSRVSDSSPQTPDAGPSRVSEVNRSAESFPRDAGLARGAAVSSGELLERDAGLFSGDRPLVGPVEPAADAGTPPPPLVAANVHNTPVELAILPFFGLNQHFGWPARNHLAIGLLAQDSTWLDGLAVAPVSYVEEETRGVQLAALVARTQGDLTGAQLSFGVNWTSGHVRGVQLGSTSFSGPLDGLQVGLLNIAGDVTGGQLGIINIAQTVHGAQVGLFNVARSSDAPVGVVNFIDDTPWRFAFELSESSLFTAELKPGGRTMYSILSAGWTPGPTFRLGGGLGAHVGHGLGWYLELEARALSLWDTRRLPSWSSQLSVGLRVNVGYQLAERIAIYAGTGGQLLFLPASVSASQYAIFSFPLTSNLSFVPSGAAGVQF